MECKYSWWMNDSYLSYLFVFFRLFILEVWFIKKLFVFLCLIIRKIWFYLFLFEIFYVNLML